MFKCVKCGTTNERNASQCERCTWPFSKDAWSSTELNIQRITIDTSCVNAKGENADLNILEQWASKGLIEIQRAEVLMRELKGPARLAKAKEVSPHPELFTIGLSTLGGAHVLAGPDLKQDIQEIIFPTTQSLTPNQANDVKHLSQHVRVGNDIFLTTDIKDFIKRGKQAALAERGIWVFPPKEAVNLLNRLYNWT